MISNYSTVTICGNVGDVVYDSETKRVITKIYSSLEGEIIDLKSYY